MFTAQNYCPACGAPEPTSHVEKEFHCDYCGSYYSSVIENGVRQVEWIGSTINESDQPAMHHEHLNQIASDADISAAVIQPSSPLKEQSTNPVLPVQSTKKVGPKKNSKLIIGIIGALLLCCGISAIIVLGNELAQTPTGTERSGSLVETIVKPTQTFTPTPYLITLPYRLKSEQGWQFEIKDIQVSTLIGAARPDNNIFLVAFIEIVNRTGEFDCIKMPEFTADNGSNSIEMENSDLDAAKKKYSLDYPGAILGQCLGTGEREQSILVFDVPTSDKEWTIILQDQEVRIGKIDTIKNPPPTATPLPSYTPTITKTPTITPTSLPSGSVNAAAGSSINVRSGPGVNYPLAFKLEGQATFTILNRNEQGDWYLIQTESDDRGWVRNDLITAIVEPTLLSISTEVIPTLTPAPTNTPTPRPTVAYSKQAPKGTWCAQNNSRGFCIAGIEYKSYIGYSSASASGRYIVFSIAVKNIGLFDISVNPFDFTMVMEDGRTYEHASETYYYNNALQAVEVSPGNSASGGLVFYVPNDVGPRKIICRGGFLESTIEIDLYDKPED